MIKVIEIALVISFFYKLRKQRAEALKAECEAKLLRLELKDKKSERKPKH
ncbi:hypothetical protein [Ligilactobacillus murinus]|nr:hypothetical protein [Ligilactobacillus murinus]MCR1891421.1 hypothetical protein [Ligilactobacillus murinus]